MTLDDVKLEGIAFLQGLVSVGLNGAKVIEVIGTTIASDEAVSLRVVEPLTCPVNCAILVSNLHCPCGCVYRVQNLIRLTGYVCSRVCAPGKIQSAGKWLLAKSLV
jgi:hypothetical protein